MTIVWVWGISHLLLALVLVSGWVFLFRRPQDRSLAKAAAKFVLGCALAAELLCAYHILIYGLSGGWSDLGQPLSVDQGEANYTWVEDWGMLFVTTIASFAASYLATSAVIAMLVHNWCIDQNQRAKEIHIAISALLLLLCEALSFYLIAGPLYPNA